jgi:drug/metabolite transporter (DMT)-like permease
VLGALGGLALLCTALAFVLFFALIQAVGPARAVVVTYVNPAVAVAAGAVLLGERVTWAIVAGFVLILAGSVLATGSRRPAPAVGPPPVAPTGGGRSGIRGFALSRHKPAR